VKTFPDFDKGILQNIIGIIMNNHNSPDMPVQFLLVRLNDLFKGVIPALFLSE
jgi:hypothetical protein